MTPERWQQIEKLYHSALELEESGYAGFGIFDEEEVPPNWASYTAKNRDVFTSDNAPGAPKR